MPFACCEPSCAGRCRALVDAWVELPEQTALVARGGPGWSLVGRGVHRRLRRSMRSRSNTEREHHDRPVALDDDDAAILSAIVSREADPTRGLSHVGQPLGYVAKARTPRIDGSK